MQIRNLCKGIKELIPALPEKDVALGNKFLEERDFESLKLLVDSAIIRVKKNLSRESPKEEYLKVDMGDLTKLKIEVDSYYSLLYPTDIMEKDIYEEMDSDEFKDEFY